MMISAGTLLFIQVLFLIALCVFLSLQLRCSRRDMRENLQDFEKSIINRIQDSRNFQQEHMSHLTDSNESRLEKMRCTVEERLKELQKENSLKLDQMRTVVEEKLEKTLETRLGKSFQIVSDRLEKVHQGLGEMKNLASGVGDLKKVLTNVKTRGTWGEIQLGTILEQMLTQDQFQANVMVKKGSQERVDFAIKLPGIASDNDDPVWIPIDAKFPQEDYHRLVEARDNGDAAALEQSVKQLENRIKLEAKNIQAKYVDPPQTTDFAILFVPTESLFAEILRLPGLFEHLQNTYRVTVAGPTTITAIINSLQMGFRTLAIEKRSSEVWSLLAQIQTEFYKFGAILDKTQKKIFEAGQSIETAASKTRKITKQLKKVEELPANEPIKISP
ncbi:DNA recombination protein RmuC [PVC group bacterium]|nr:DNA recombination protein RmuC [PVC group bacterium]